MQTSLRKRRYFQQLWWFSQWTRCPRTGRSRSGSIKLQRESLMSTGNVQVIQSSLPTPLNADFYPVSPALTFRRHSQASFPGWFTILWSTTLLEARLEVNLGFFNLSPETSSTILLVILFRTNFFFSLTGLIGVYAKVTWANNEFRMKRVGSERTAEGGILFRLKPPRQPCGIKFTLKVTTRPVRRRLFIS